MARFQVFIPKSEKTPIDNLMPQTPLEAVGLSDLIAGACGERSMGPEEQDGLLISWPNPPDVETGYKPERQTWVPAVARDGFEERRYWVGLWKDKLPTQSDLIRPYPYAGKHVKLNDDAQWLIPVARELPNEMKLADDGSFEFVVQRKFHKVWTEAYKWAEKFGDDAADGSFQWPDLISYIIEVIKLNYMLTDEVISELRLFSQANILESLVVVCGGENGGQ